MSVPLVVMRILVNCIAFSLTLAMTTDHQLIGDPPQLMIPQHPNVYVYENNSVGECQNLVLPCPLVNTTNVTYKWFRGTEMVSSEMVDQTTGTLTVCNITDGEYASKAGVNYYCVASRVIGKGSYTASVRSRTITVFYASFGRFRRMTEEDVFVPVALASEVALECDVLPSNPSPQITWHRDGNVVVRDTRRQLLDGGRYLYVSGLEEADLMSTYHCEVTNALADRTIRAPTTYRLLDNLTRGELFEYKQIGDLRAFTVNASIEFAFVSGGFTDSLNGTTNRLTRDGTPITSVGNIGVINDLSTLGTSNLEATVTFGGSALDRSGTLTVYQLPRITMRPPDNREIVVGEENLMYSCEFEGSPTPSIQWFFNGQPIAAESGVSTNDSTLIIASPRFSNSGIYQCIVSNEFGDDQAAWLLEIRPTLPRVMPYNFTELGAFDDRDLGALIVQDNATIVNFFVDVVADPCPDITWFFNGTQLGPVNSIFTYSNPCVGATEGSSPNWRFTLNLTLTEVTSGSYSASFTNIAGTTQLPPAYFTIPAPVSVSGLTLSLPCLREGENVTLHCSVSGFPRPNVTFSSDGSLITPGEGIYANFIEQTLYDEITILNVNSTAEGQYSCMAVGVTAEETLPAMYAFCTIPMITVNTTNSLEIGSPFSIQCTAAGIPQPSITWTKDGLPLEPTDDQVLQIVDGGRTSSVEVSVGRTKFNGIYECIAMNNAGSDNDSVRIELQDTETTVGPPLVLSVGATIGLSIAAICVGVLLFIGLFILSLVCAYACGRRTGNGKVTNRHHMSQDDTIATGSPNQNLLMTKFSVQSSLKLNLPPHLIITASTVQLKEIIGQGEFGIVYKAHITKHKDGQVVTEIMAVKTLKGFYDRTTVKELLKECSRMYTLDHPNVLTLSGVCLDGGTAPYIIMPFMANGNLLAYLKTNRSTLVVSQEQADSDEEVAADTLRKRLMDICFQIAKGMEYLAAMKIVHRDLATRNCMIDVNFVIKVADFGLSEGIEMKEYFRQDKGVAIKLPVKWLAPECLDDYIFSEKSDVWAYGVTCWEIFSGGKTPYPGVVQTDLPRMLSEGHRLEKPINAACNNEMYALMLQCWMFDPNERPPFSHLVNSLSQSIEEMVGYMDVFAFGELTESHDQAETIAARSETQ